MFEQGEWWYFGADAGHALNPHIQMERLVPKR